MLQSPLPLHYEGISELLKTQRPYIQYAFEKGLFTNKSQEIIKQYLYFNLNQNHDDDETLSDCINADDINDDDQDAPEAYNPEAYNFVSMLGFFREPIKIYFLIRNY